jgi:signal transduction histidine kinase
MRERRTLALVNAVNLILHAADTESGTEPVSLERLREHFSQVCAHVGDSLHGAEISLYLRGCERDGCYPYFAGWPTPTSGVRTTSIAISDASEPHLESGPTQVEELLTNGSQVWGVLRCRSAIRARAIFTHADRSVLRPVAAQLARYWANWLNRRSIFEENESWRDLANGITEFNKILAEALRKGGPTADHQPEVAAAALRVASNVVPAATGTAVYVAPCCQSLDRPLPDVASAFEGEGVSEAGRVQAEHAYRTCIPRTVRATVPNGNDELGPRWIIGTPIRVGQQSYGALAAEGPGAEPPANSAQVYEILSDQVGLYRHLAHTMDALKTAQQELKANLTRQADAMEDLKHQLVSPLRAATDRTDLVLRLGRFDRRTKRELEAARGLCRKASRVAMSAGVFAALSKGEVPSPRPELLGAGDLQRMLIAAADDCQTLSNPEMGRRFTVDRGSLDALGRRLVQADSSFLQQCVGNLLDNSDKYSYPRTEVVIAAAVTDQQLSIRVVSTGIPVLLDDRLRCLERNWRGPDARNSTGEGSGIGLWIVDHLMRSMNGRVELEPVGDLLTVALILPTT